MIPTTEYALFPLSTVIFPGGVLPMRIFEPRYLEMVSHCMQSGDGFVICAAQPAATDGGFAHPRSVGTYTRITDFDRLDDGQLGITASGIERVTIDNVRQTANGQWWGRLDAIAEDADGPCPIEFAPLKQIAEALIKEMGLSNQGLAVDYDSANWLSGRLTELLPFDAAVKHELLAMNDPQERLRRIRPMIEIDTGGT